jgi:ribosomal protein L9
MMMLVAEHLAPELFGPSAQPEALTKAETEDAANQSNEADKEAAEQVNAALEAMSVQLQQALREMPPTSAVFH